MQKIIFLFIFLIVGSYGFGQDTSEINLFFGEYTSNKKFDHVNLTLNADSTYEQNWNSCTFYFKAKGLWVTHHDTLHLNPTKIKAKRGQSVSKYVATQQGNKYLIRQDTLYTLIDKDVEYSQWFPLTRKQ